MTATTATMTSKTKTDLLADLIREHGTSVSPSWATGLIHARLGEAVSKTTFYRARERVKAERAKTPNVAERPMPSKTASKAGNGVEAKATPTPLDDIAAAETTGGPVVTDLPDGWTRTTYTRANAPALPATTSRPVTPIIALAVSLGGLMALRRAVDELIAGLAPEIVEGKEARP